MAETALLRDRRYPPLLLLKAYSTGQAPKFSLIFRKTKKRFLGWIGFS
jgi:hypothetical protein